jgi:phage gpG-like protein
MAGGVLDCTVDPTELVELLRGFRERGGDLSPAMDICAQILSGGVSDMYDSSGHGAWPELAESTKAARRGGGTSDKPLVDSGVLSGSTEAASGTDWAMASTGQDYIKYHLDGGPIIPRRNPFDLPDEVIDDCVDAILAHIAEEP